MSGFSGREGLVVESLPCLVGEKVRREWLECEKIEGIVSMLGGEKGEGEGVESLPCLVAENSEKGESGWVQWARG